MTIISECSYVPEELVRTLVVLLVICIVLCIIPCEVTRKLYTVSVPCVIITTAVLIIFSCINISNKGYYIIRIDNNYPVSSLTACCESFQYDKITDTFKVRFNSNVDIDAIPRK